MYFWKRIRLPGASMLLRPFRKSRFIRRVSPTHDDVMTSKYFLYYWPFVRRIHCSSVHCPHNGSSMGSFGVWCVVSLKCCWTNRPLPELTVIWVAAMHMWRHCIGPTQRNYFPTCQARSEFKSYIALQWRRLSDMVLSKSPFFILSV